MKKLQKQIRKYFQQNIVFTYTGLLIFISGTVSGQTTYTFGGLGGSNSGGTGYKIVSANSDIAVSNQMANDGTDMWASADESFEIIAYGNDDFTFNGMNFHPFGNNTLDVNATIVFKDKDGTILQTMSMNIDKRLD